MMAMRTFGIILAVCASPRRRPRCAQAQQQQPVSALKGHDSNAPVDVTADRIEVQDRADRAIFAGNVHVTQAELTLDTAAADRRLFERRRRMPDPPARRRRRSGRPQPVRNRARATSASTISTAS